MENVSDLNLNDLAAQHLRAAAEASSGRSAQTLYGGAAHTLRQTLIALAAGQQLHEHENPGEATLQVLEGAVRLVAGDTEWQGAAGDLMMIPDASHRLEASEPSVVLLTVAKLL